MNVLVIGARGRVGRGVLDGLLTAGASVRAGARDPSALVLPDSVQAVAVDLDRPDTLPAALDGVDAVFCYAAASLDDFADAARTAGVKHVVLLSSSYVVEADPATNAVAAHHAHAEEVLQAAGLTVTALRPGPFCGNTLQWAPAIASGHAVELPYPNAHIAPIHEQDITDVAVAALTTGAGRGEAPLLTGPQSLSFADQAGVLSRELGRDVRVQPIDPDDARRRMSSDMPAPYVDSLLPMWAAADGVPATVNGEVERLTGHPARPFAQWAQEHRDAFADTTKAR